MLPFDWQLVTYQKLQHLEIYATSSTATFASEAYNAAYRWGVKTEFGKDADAFYELNGQYDEAEAALLAELRADLSIPSDT